LAKCFQKRFKCEKFTTDDDDGRRTKPDGKSSHGLWPGELKKGCTRLAATSDNKVYQLLAHGRWFSLGTPAFSTTKTGCHDIAEILLKVALIKHQKSNQSIIHIRSRK